VDGAIAAHREAIRLNLDISQAHNSLAWLLATAADEKLRDPKLAVLSARRAVELAPLDTAYWNTLGVALYRNGQWEDAVAALNRSVQLQGSGSSWWDFFFLAMAHWQLGHQDEARVWYDKGVQCLEPHSPSPVPREEGLRFRAEAAAVLGIKAAKP
jgi:tetratricopeptide (TPR) repeat protein